MTACTTSGPHDNETSTGVLCLENEAMCFVISDTSTKFSLFVFCIFVTVLQVPDNQYCQHDNYMPMTNCACR